MQSTELSGSCVAPRGNKASGGEPARIMGLELTRLDSRFDAAGRLAGLVLLVYVVDHGWCTGSFLSFAHKNTVSDVK